MYVEHARGDERDLFVRPTVAREGVPDPPVGIRESTPARGGQKAVREPGGAVYRGVCEGADVDRWWPLRPRPERQILEAPPS